MTVDSNETLRQHGYGYAKVTGYEMTNPLDPRHKLGISIEEIFEETQIPEWEIDLMGEYYMLEFWLKGYRKYFADHGSAEVATSW